MLAILNVLLVMFPSNHDIHLVDCRLYSSYWNFIAGVLIFIYCSWDSIILSYVIKFNFANVYNKVQLLSSQSTPYSSYSLSV